MEQPRLDGNVMVGMETQLSNGAVLQGRCVASNERSTGLQATNSASRKDSNGARLRGGSSVSNSHNLGSASSGCASPATAFENSDGQLLVAAWRTRREKIQGRGNLQYLHVELIKGIVRQIVVEWDDFFYSRTDSRYGGMIRIFYALVALFNTGHLMMDFDVFFVHFIPVSTGRDSWDRDPDIHTIFTFPSTEEEQVVWLQRGAMIWLAQLVFLLIGVAPRFNAVGNFFWHCMFQHHNRLVYTGADFVLRLLAFFVIFLPLHKYTLWDLLGFRKKQQRISSMDTWPMWPFRLIQLEMCLIFFSCVMMKFAGKDWRDGIAMHYVVHIEDHFGKGFNPDFLFGYTGALKALTYKTLVLETLAPITLWFDSTRKATLVLVILFHLGIEMSMNLEMFHWIMVVGWSSFLAQPMVESKEEEPASSTAKLLDNKTGNSKEPEKKRLRRGGNLNQKKKRKK